MAHEFLPGDRLGRYQLESVLGGGGFATVWRARAEGPGGFGRAVAIKVIRPARASQKRFQQMLLDEARLVARIEHPNVAQVWEVGEDPRSLYVVMELVEGASLDDLRERAEERGERLSPRVVFRVLSDVCAGLHAAHELESEGSAELLGLVHRDISPHNVLVSRHGIAKLIDFGIAKAKERISGETTTGIIKGKLAFMAPEQARAEPTVDRRVDIWAIGAVAFELLEGRPPFDAATDVGRLTALAGPAPAPPLNDRVPAPLRRVVARALQKDVAARYPTALALREAIEEALIESELETSTHEVAEELSPLFRPLSVAPPPAEDGTLAAGPLPALATPTEPRDRPVSTTQLAVRETDAIELPIQRSVWGYVAAGLVLTLPVAWWWLRDDPPAPEPPAEPTQMVVSSAPPARAATGAPLGSAPIPAGSTAAVSGPETRPMASIVQPSVPVPSSSPLPVRPRPQPHPTAKPRPPAPLLPTPSVDEDAIE